MSEKILQSSQNNRCLLIRQVTAPSKHASFLGFSSLSKAPSLFRATSCLHSVVKGERIEICMEGFMTRTGNGIHNSGYFFGQNTVICTI
jgi:hypothetical protein